MKQHFNIVKSAWLHENLNCEVIASFDYKDDAEHYFQSAQKEFFDEMKKNYTACNYEWREDFKVYCFCNEGCAELALLVASEDTFAKSKVLSMVKKMGEIGTTETEKYVEIYSDITYNGMELAQMIWLDDTATLQAYFIDEHNEGLFVDWDDLSEEKQKEIANLSIWE